MAVYHVFVVPRPGCTSDPAKVPLAPFDVEAESETEAIAEGETIIAMDAQHL